MDASQLTRVASGARASSWAAYDAWNAAIEREIFSGQWADRPVYLDLEDELLARIAGSIDGAAEDPGDALIAAVRPTLHPRPDRVGLFAEHIDRERQWRAGHAQGTPPFLAVLAFLSVIAEGMRTDEEYRSSNYYGRVEAALGVDSSCHAKIVRGFMDESHVLWASMNSWLEDHQGRLGLPTAYAFDYRVHVGIPMSQALVAAGDRLILRDLFIAYRLRPGQSLSRSDMARLLQEWLPASAVSLTLKRLCHQREPLERVADIASVELLAWDGSPREERRVGTHVTTDLLLSAFVRRHPRRRLLLDLAIHTLAPIPPGRYSLEADCGSHATAALAETGRGLTLQPTGADGWRGFAESASVSFPDVLFASLRLVRQGATLRRAPVRLVVLEYDEDQRRYIEVNRITLGRDNLILCHESLSAELERTLTAIARLGYSRSTAAELPGLPDGWLAYERTEILALTETRNADLAALVPMSWTQVALGGGYPIPGRHAWIRQSPPEVRATSLVERELALTLTCERSLAMGEPQPRTLATFTGSYVATLEDDLPDGDYRLSITELGGDGSTLGSSIARIRSADHPRIVLDGRLAYDLADAWGAISAEPTDAQADSYRGAWISNAANEDPEAIVPARAVPEALRLVPVVAEEDSPESPPVDTHTKGGDAPLCLMGTAGHHFIIEGGDRYPWMHSGWEGTCKHCGLEKWFPRRPVSKQQRRRQPRGRYQRRAAPAAAPIAPLEAPPIAIETAPDLDMLLEALSFAQAGTWSSYDALASRVEDAPWFPLESARLLTALGHIDLQLSRDHARPERWAIAPSVLTVPALGGPAFLSGYRSEELVTTLASRAEAHGGRLTRTETDGAPLVITVAGLDAGALPELATEMASESGNEILTRQPADPLAMRLPTLDDIEATLPILERALSSPAEQFDFERSTWTRVDEIDEPGAYRFLTTPITLVAKVSRSAPLRLVDNRLVKWLPARALGVEMLAYDRGTTTLRCPLGAQLPGLYERAAVLASGRPPVQRTDGTVTYAGVPPEIAGALWARLGPSPA